MSRRFASLLLGLSLAACASGASAQRVALVTQHGVAGDRAEWLHGSAMHTRLHVGADGETYLGVWIDTPVTTQGAVQRAPLDVALVVDTSGSMSGEKIHHARVAASSFIDGLAEGDIVSLYSFSSGVTELAPPTVVTATSRAMLLQRVAGLYAAGGTNLYGGLQVATNAAAQAPPTHPVRRVVMISDGRGNIGPASAEELGDLAARATENGTQVTAIGVGLDYDEGTLGALAVRSAGRLYHLEAPQQMATILHDELELLGQTVASNAVIELDAAPGVVFEGTDNLRVDRQDNRLRIPLGALHGGQHREVLVRVRARVTWAAPTPPSPRPRRSSSARRPPCATRPRSGRCRPRRPRSRATAPAPARCSARPPPPPPPPAAAPRCR
jgi:Ca-activated chloride channel family protein